jgi:Ca2+-binding EF-hand superfamily protein
MMVRNLGSVFVGFLLAAAPSMATAHDCEGASPRDALGGRFFERADGNGDGKVELREAHAAALSRFEQADTDRDGVVLREEAEGSARADRAHHLEQRFRQLDLDRDGVVSARELARQRGFLRFDRDRDGRVTRQELTQANLSERPLGHGRSWLRRFETWDLDRDGRVTRTEVQHEAGRRFRAGDANRDGVLSRSEAKARRRAAHR